MSSICGGEEPRERSELPPSPCPAPCPQSHTDGTTQTRTYQVVGVDGVDLARQRRLAHCPAGQKRLNARLRQQLLQAAVAAAEALLSEVARVMTCDPDAMR